MKKMTKREVVVFGGGCFWCTEAVFKMLRGVLSVEPGYAGGSTPNPKYDDVSRGLTDYVEVVKIEYNPEEIKFRDLLTVFFGSHDPTTKNKQGNDVGTQYRSVIFYTSPEQKREAEKFIAEINASNAAGAPVVTSVEPLATTDSPATTDSLRGFYPAEGYHRDYFEKNSNAPYCELVINPKLEKVKREFAGLLDEINWKDKMTPEQYRIMREKGTEAPFTGKYLHDKRSGDYVCAACGHPLFSSDAKFDSGTGWPSFDKALPDALRTVTDESMGMTRTEIICKKCGSHLGHVFDDGPTETGKRYCLNSVCLDLKEEPRAKNDQDNSAK